MSETAPASGGRPPPAVDPACPDAELVRRIHSGDEEAFRGLYATHHAKMVRLAAVFVADLNTAEEVTQETWITVLEKIGTFEGRSALKTWIYRILTNKAKKRGIKDKRTVPFTSMGTRDESSHALDADLFLADGHWKSTPEKWGEDTPQRLAESAETRAFVLAKVEELPPKERAVVRLRDLELWTSEEVCELLEISAVYQRVLLHRGRTKLRGALAAYLQREDG